MPGPALRTDIVEVYVFAQDDRGDVRFLQLRRARQPMAGSWQPVMGHIEEGETAVQAGVRELREETGLSPMLLDDDKNDNDHNNDNTGGAALWQLEAVNTFYLAAIEAIMLCPGLAVQVEAHAEVTLDHSHDAWRWVTVEEAPAAFLWPGQQTAVMQIAREIAPPEGSLRRVLRLG